MSYMFHVLDKFQIGDRYCVSVAGDIQQLKNGLKLVDEKGSTFKIETVAMSEYKIKKDYKKRAELVLFGDVKTIGNNLFLNT